MPRIKWRSIAPALLLTTVQVFAGTELPPPPEPQGSKLVAESSVPEPTGTSGDNTYGRLEDIQAKTVLYEAQLAQAKALSELQKNGYDVMLGAPFNPLPATTQMKDKTEVKPAQDSKSLPQIVEIAGGQKLTATLQLENGNQIRVQAGNRIPGTVWTVARITLGEVTVSSTTDGLVSLAFGG